MWNKRKNNCTHPLLIETTTATIRRHIMPSSPSTIVQRVRWRLLWMKKVRLLLLMMIRVKPSTVSASKLIGRETSTSSTSSSAHVTLKWRWTTTSPSQ